MAIALPLYDDVDYRLSSLLVEGTENIFAV
jgi:hypothetical protein